MKWANSNIGNRILMAKKMAEQSTKHIETLSNWGLTLEKVEAMDQLIEEIEVQRAEQESLKSSWKKKTEELNNNVKKLYDKHYSVTKKLIKLEYTNPYWKVFGIEDKK